MNNLRNVFKIIAMLKTWVFWKLRQACTKQLANEPQQILVLYLSGMGDILCDSFFFQQLRNKYPQAQLIACFPAHFCEVQQRFFAFDAYIRHRSYIATLKAINKLQPDLIIVPGWLLRNSLLAIFSHGKAIIGYINDLSFSNRYLNSFRVESAGQKISRQIQDMRNCHLAERPNAILKALGQKALNADEIIISRHKQASDYAVIHAGARFPGRRWLPAGFAEIAVWMLDSKLVHKIYLIGDGEDAVINKQIIALARHPEIQDRAGQGSLLDSYHLIAGAKLFIGNDSGPTHIAALCGVPTLALMGPNFPYISKPLGANSRYIFHKFACSGCNQRDCSFAYRCIKAISCDEVKSQIMQLIGDL